MSLRPLEDGDLELLLAWRNDRDVMRWLPSATFPLTWAEHWGWFHDARRPGLRHDWIMSLDDNGTRPRRVGMTHWIPSTGEVGLLIGEKPLWGQGVGRVALELTLRVVGSLGWEKRLKEVPRIWAVVHPENVASVRLFESLNFVAAGEGRHGQTRYEWRGWPT